MLLILIYLIGSITISLVFGFTKIKIPPFLYEFTQLLGFLCVALLIFAAGEDLRKYSLERYSLISILVFPGLLSSIPSDVPGILMILFFLLPLVVAVILYRRLHKVHAFKIGNVRDISQYIILGIAVSALFLFIVIYFWYSNINVLNTLINANPVLIISYFTENMSTVAAIEEPILRGFLLGYLINDRKWVPLYAILFQSLIFWIPHIYQFDNPFLLRLVIPIFGMILGWVTYKRKSIMPGILAHAIYNTIIQSL